MWKIRPGELSQRVVIDLKKRSAIGIIFYIIAALTVIFSGGYYYRHPSFSNQFFGFISSICLFRMVHMTLDRYLPKNQLNTIVFITSIILTSLIWGVAFAKFTFQEAELYTQLLLVTCTIGLCAGGVVAYIPCLWLSLIFNACIMLPGTMSLLFFSGNPSLGFLFLLFFLYMIAMAKRQSNEYWTALDNEYLLEQKTKTLKRLSYRDGLTGLYNRRYFDRALAYEWKRAIRQNTSVGVLICDLDFFKNINDQYGHLAGDEYLKMAAGLLEQVFRRETDVVARYGGEEFVVLMPEETLETAKSLSETTRQTIAINTLEFENQSISTTISMGLSMMTPGPGMDIEILLSEADKALYKAKSEGRNRLCLNQGQESI